MPSKKPAAKGEASMNGGGRPRFNFSDKLSLIRKLASIQCTDEEIAAGLGCSQDTLARGRKREPDLDAAILEGRANGRMSLRRAQYRKAMEGNPTMLIWLGKQILGQRERVDIDLGSRISAMSPEEKMAEAARIARELGAEI